MYVYIYIYIIHIHILWGPGDPAAAFRSPGRMWRRRCRRSKMPRTGASSWRPRLSACRMRTGGIGLMLIDGLEYFFSIYWECHHPQLTFIFFRGVETTNQVDFGKVLGRFSLKVTLGNYFHGREDEVCFFFFGSR